ncbi:MAG TPA: nitronate monooxygenase [Myxococcota bacterium]|nr:nitronate monooxygenase [Myxococcota bacterium]
MIETAFTKLVGASVPIQVASMPGFSTPELLCAVAGAGAVAMVGGGLMPAKSLEALLERLPRDTPGAIGVNFLVPFLDPDCIPIAARGASIVEFFYGEPNARWVEQAHALGALVSWQVGSVDEAIAAERAGCDFVIAQGTEAGGHVRGATSLLPLLSRVLETVRIPVLAAGGLATARDLAAVLACGAGGARMGTRFAASSESGAHPSYVKSLLAATAADTCLTQAFSGMWPDAPHRVLRSAIEAAEMLPEGVIGEVPLDGRMFPVERFSVLPPTIGSTGHLEAMALYAGESVTNVTSVRPAAELIAGLVAGAEKLLRDAAPQ